MKYEEPNVLLLANAAGLLQGQGDGKGSDVRMDGYVGSEQYTTGSAYQSDE
jgi:hypothetical protein